MCVIIEIPRGKKFPEEKMINAVNNNPHGFGIVWLDDNGVEAQHFISDKDNDPVSVMMALEEHNKTSDAYLHLRYKTRGTVSLENTHPFIVQKDEKNEVYMMHNGTFTDLDKYGAALSTDESDSSQFNRVLLQPLLSSLKFENDLIDPSDPMLKMILSKFVDGGNRVLLLGNNGLPGFFGNWSKVTYGEDNFFASNDTYFDKDNARAPWYGGTIYYSGWKPQGKKPEEKKEGGAKSGGNKPPISNRIDYSSDDLRITNLKDMEERLRSCSDLNIKCDELAGLINNLDPYLTLDEACLFSELRSIEIENLINQEKENDQFVKSISQLLIGLSSYVHDLREDLEVQETKLKSATNIIAGLKREQRINQQAERKVG